MKVLVTGGAGFIGTNYVFYHFEKYEDDQIFVLDNLSYAGNLENLKILVEEKRFKFIQGDICNLAFLMDLFEKEKFDLVINFAAQTHVDRSILDPGIFVETNVLGTQNLLEASRLTGVGRFHQISTDEVYGDLPLESENKFDENARLLPNSPYAASKASADLIVRSYFVTFQMPITISRCSNNYGPYQFPEKLIPYFFGLLGENKPVPLYGDGKNVRDWIYVEDHCRAIDLIVRSGKLGETYNVGANSELSNLELTKLILNFLGKDESLINYVNDRPGHDRKYALDSARIERELGFKPVTNFEQGIRMTFEWYDKNNAWVEGLKNRMVERKHFEISETPLKPSRN